MESEPKKIDINSLISSQKDERDKDVKANDKQNTAPSITDSNSVSPNPVAAETPPPETSMINVFGQVPTTHKKQGPKKTLAIIGIFIFLLALVGGIILIKGEELGLLKQKPVKVLGEMIQNMEKAKTVHSEGSGKVVVSNSAKSGQSVTVDFKFKADEDVADEKNVKANMNYDFSLSMEGMSFSGNFDMIIADKIIYFRLNKAPLLSFADLGKFKGKWIKIDPVEIEKMNTSVSGDIKTIEAADEMNEKIKEVLKKYSTSLINIQKELPGETVNGASVYSYQITLNKDAFVQFFNEIQAISKEISGKNNLPGSVPANKASDEIQKKLSNDIIGLISDKSNIKILIGKKDKLLYGTVLDMKLNGKEIADIMSSVSGSLPSATQSKDIENMSIDMNFNIKYSDYDKPVKIDVPEDAESFTKVLGLDAAKQKANDAKRMSELQQLRTALVLYYDDNNIYPVAQTMQKTSDKNSVLNALVPKYISKMPVDPLEPNYYYGYKSDGKSYEITARAETPNSTYCKKITDTLCLFSVSGKDGM